VSGGRRLARAAAIVALAALAAGCPRATLRAPHPTPTVDAVLAALAGRRALARSFNHTALMDFFSDDDRLKNVTVYVMGERGSRLRLNVLDPASGGSTIADLACDGADFELRDYRRDCQLVGPCDADSIASLMRVRLTPDDFVLLALGQPPLVPGALRGGVRWDEDDGRWIVELVAPDRRTERLELSGDPDRRWDVVRAELRRADGGLEWELTQKGFSPLSSPAGTLRVPGRLRFEQPAQRADLIVRWKERALDPTLAADKFRMRPAPGLRTCPRGKRG
jgi:hypothetical protein